MAANTRSGFEPIVVSAPGKVILHGEHAVVYGKTALAAAVNLRTYLLVLPNTEDDKFSVQMLSVGLSREWSKEELCSLTELVSTTDESGPCPPSEEFLKHLEVRHQLRLSDTSPATLASIGFLHLLTSILRHRLRSLPGLRFIVASTLPVSAGLGSSATFAVCMAAGMHQLAMRLEKGIPPTGDVLVGCDSSCPISTLPGVIAEGLQEYCCKMMSSEIKTYANLDISTDVKNSVNMWAFECERLIHGTPSGIDNTTSCFGGVIGYTSGQTRHLNKLPQLRILLSHTKIPRSTKIMVSEVRRRWDTHPQVVNPILQSIHAISESCEKILQEFSGSELDAETAKYLCELMEFNQHLLNAVGVGHYTFDLICRTTKEFGFSSKLTGAGGGGCAITLITPGPETQSKVNQCRAKLAEHGFDSWETELGCRGVTVHSVL